MGPRPRRVLVTLPVYNEAPRLEGCVRELVRVLDRAPEIYRLAIAEDGSTDGTQEIIAALTAEYPQLIVQSLRDRKGRGFALKSLWSRVDADVYAFTDVDLAVEPRSILAGVQSILRGADVVTGSRYVVGSVVRRPPLRSTISRSYNALIRLLFGDTIRDHQCGLKLFTREALDALLPRTSEDTWFWDTEILLTAFVLGLSVQEIPVNWVERKNPRTGLRRLASDVFLHGAGLIRLKGNLTTVHSLDSSLAGLSCRSVDPFPPEG